MTYRPLAMLIVGSLMTLCGCGLWPFGGSKAAAPNAASAAKPDPKAPAPAAAPAKAAAEPEYPATAEAKLGTVNGKSASFKRAFITTEDGSTQLQAFTLDDITAEDVCPTGLRFVKEGTLLEVRFGEASQVKSPKAIYVQTDKPRVNVKKAFAKLTSGNIKPGAKVTVNVEVEGSNKTKLKGPIEAVVCYPPKA